MLRILIKGVLNDLIESFFYYSFIDNVFGWIKFLLKGLGIIYVYFLFNFGCLWGYLRRFFIFF